MESLIDAVDLPEKDLCTVCWCGKYWFTHQSTQKFLKDGRI